LCIEVFNGSGEEVGGVVSLSESLINSHHVVQCTVSINVCNGTSDNGTAISIDANLVTSNELGEISNEHLDVTNSNLLENSGRDLNGSEDQAIGFVVLASSNDISNDNETIGDTGRLRVLVSGCKNVSRNASRSSDGSSGANNVVYNSLNNSRERLSLNCNCTSSSNVNDPRGSEPAFAERIPSDLAEISSVNSHVVKISVPIARDKKSISILEFILGIVGKSRESLLNGSEVRLGIIKES